jgi:predicted XRE-type DNA-binding protein
MLRGFSGIIEIVNDYATNTYRAVYAIKIDDNIYVLHVFQKKSKRGIATTKHDLEIVKKRLQQAKQMAKENMSEKAEYTVGSGNAFKDLGFDRPEEELAKSDLAIQINKIIEQMGWTQKKAATVLGIDQPKISALKNGRLGGFFL